MIDPFYVIAIIIAVGIFYIIPIIIIYFAYKFAKRKTNGIIANSILAFMTIIFLYISYADFYPSENSYKRNFEEKTKLNFPKSAKFLEKVSANSIFDFGGRMYCSKIEINENDYLQLKNKIEDSKFIKVESYTEKIDTDVIFSEIKMNEIDKIYCKKTSFDEYFVIFLTDKKTLIMFYRKWT
jgi:hypothetical protein